MKSTKLPHWHDWQLAAKKKFHDLSSTILMVGPERKQQ